MKIKILKKFLNKKVLKYNNINFIKNDPIQIPHKFKKKEDIEISAFLTSTISWGYRKTIIKNAKKLIKLMDNDPYNFIINYKISDLKKFKNFKHRTFKFSDLSYFFKSLKNIYKKHKNLSNVFFIKKNEINTEKSIIRFRKIFFSIPCEGNIKKHISNPEIGSASKKINMFLRWMVRDDEIIDLGIWKHIPKNKLSCPLDIHSGKIAGILGLISRKNNDIIAVRELDEKLRILDNKDPVKYDFALFGIGIIENLNKSLLSISNK